MNSEIDRKGTVIGGGMYHTEKGVEFVLSLINLDKPTEPVSTIPLSFLPHGVCMDPMSPNRAAVFEKIGPGAALVDLSTKEKIGAITTPPTRKFYGHGVFSSDGRQLFSTESVITKQLKGVLVIRDSVTLKDLGTVPTYGVAPHDCVLLPDGNTLVVANGGGATKDTPPSVTFIELSSGKLLEKLVVIDPSLNAGHVAVASDRTVALVSAPRAGLANPERRLGGVSLGLGGSLKTLTSADFIQRRLLGETLSVLIDESHREVLATQPLGNLISRWSLDTGESLGAVEIENPRGIGLSLDNRWYLVAHTKSPSVRLSVFDVENWKPVSWYVDPSFITGSHIFVHNLSNA